MDMYIDSRIYQLYNTDPCVQRRIEISIPSGTVVNEHILTQGVECIENSDKVLEVFLHEGIDLCMLSDILYYGIDMEGLINITQRYKSQHQSISTASVISYLIATIDMEVDYMQGTDLA